MPCGVVDGHAGAAVNLRAASERRVAQGTGVPNRGRQTHAQGVPKEIRKRHGDRVRRGLNRNYPAANAPSWQRLDTAVSAFISRPQLLEVSLGRKARMVSRAILEQVKRLSPHIDLQLPWHCCHAMFDGALTAAFMGVLNRNLLTAGEVPVTVAEFHRFVGCFLMRCLVVGGAQRRGLAFFGSPGSSWIAGGHDTCGIRARGTIYCPTSATRRRARACRWGWGRG